MQFQPEILNKILQLKNQANIELLQLKAELEEAKARDKLLTDLFTFLSKGWSMHFLNLADSEAERLRKGLVNLTALRTPICLPKKTQKKFSKGILHC